MKFKASTITKICIFLTTALSILCVIFIAFTSKEYNSLKESYNDYNSAVKIIDRFEGGVNKLSRKVRQAVFTSKQSYIDDYFVEINVLQSRESAVEELSSLFDSKEVNEYLQRALSLSNKKVTNDLYALCLIEHVIADENTHWPSELADYELSYEDLNLSDKEKKEKAIVLISSENYENDNTFISNEITTTLTKVSNIFLERESKANEAFASAFLTLIIVVCALIFMMFFNCYLMFANVVKPILNYDRAIKNDELIPLQGVKELRILASTYNEIFTENQEREKIMKHNAEHDPLTNALNRGAFDSILDIFTKDQSNFALIIVDIDNFKTINDTYGHSVGDVILKKVANSLTNAFRTIDHVCRIGGDEFAVIMVDMTSSLNYTINEKIEVINKELSTSKDGEPIVTLSIGVALTDRKNPSDSIFNDADNALYRTKENGRNGITFY